MVEPEQENQVENIRRVERWASLVNHFIVALLMVCLSITLLMLARRIAPPGWNGSYLPFLEIIISIEAMYTWRRSRRWADVNVSGFVYWAIEWIVILIVIKLFLYTWNGFGQFLTDLALWQKDFFAYFFNTEMVFATLSSILVWVLSGLYAADLVQLEGDEVFYRLDDLEGFRSDRGKVRQSMVTRFFVTGFVMVLITAFIHFDFKALRSMPNIPGSALANILAYFLLGLVLLSQTRFAMLRANWAMDHIPVAANISRRWIFFSLFFLVMAAIVAFVLPTRYSLGLLSTLNYIFSLISAVIYIIGLIIIFPILSFIGYLLSLIFGKSPINPPANPAAPPSITPPATNPITSQVPWWEFVKSFLFWAFLLGLVSYALYQYISQNKELLSRLRRFTLFSWIWEIFQGIGRWLAGVNQQVSQGIQNRIQAFRDRRSALARMAPGFINLRRLSPRQRVMFFYLALIRRGGESGIPRALSQTPLEYEQSLKANLPEAQEDVGSMTEAFVEARYSRHEINDERASTVRQYWDRVRRALRTRKK
ncbi:MAG: DUF4129 domain-containing protein [Omnitrophica WOR_2 bacterium]